tara:strand:+ start:470 stop:697 length:228 start_codon:yes stop_codon:yes gene_type:complete
MTSEDQKNARAFMQWYFAVAYRSNKKIAEHLNELDNDALRWLRVLVSTLGHDLDRHDKRRICEDQLFENETLRVW